MNRRDCATYCEWRDKSFSCRRAAIRSLKRPVILTIPVSVMIPDVASFDFNGRGNWKPFCDSVAWHADLQCSMSDNLHSFIPRLHMPTFFPAFVSRVQPSPSINSVFGLLFNLLEVCFTKVWLSHVSHPQCQRGCGSLAVWNRKPTGTCQLFSSEFHDASAPKANFTCQERRISKALSKIWKENFIQNVDAERKALVKFINGVKRRRFWTFRLLVDIRMVHLENLHLQTSHWKAARTPSMAGRCAGCRAAMTFLRHQRNQKTFQNPCFYPCSIHTSIAFKLHQNWFEKRTCHTTREYPIPTIQSTPRYPLESVQLLPMICMVGPDTSRDKRWKGFSIFFRSIDFIIFHIHLICISYSSHIHLIHPPPPPPPPPPPSHHRTCSCKFQLIESQGTFDFAQDNHVCQRVAGWIASITCTRPDSTTQTLFSRRFK